MLSSMLREHLVVAHSNSDAVVIQKKIVIAALTNYARLLVPDKSGVTKNGKSTLKLTTLSTTTFEETYLLLSLRQIMLVC